MKKVHVTLLTLLALASALTVGCGVSSSSKPSLPTYTQLVFSSNRASDPSTPLFLMNLDGTNVTPVPLTPTDGMWWPSLSADGSVIAFEDDDNTWLSNASGSTQTQLTTDEETWEQRLSPDGKKLYYVHENTSTGIEDAFVANVDGSSPVNLSSTITSSSVYCYSGSFSADSSKVVFACWDENADFANIYTANADGTGLTPVLTQSTYCNWWCDTPAFSQDATKILFISYSVPTGNAQPHRFVAPRAPSFKGRRRPTPKGIAPGTTWGIASMNADGTGLTTFAPGAYELEVLNSKLYYTFEASGTSTDQIFSANLDGSNAVALTDGTNDDRLGLED